MNSIEQLLKKKNIRYMYEENYPDEIVRMDLHRIYVLPDTGTIFDPYRTLGYNKISELEMLNYKVYQPSDLDQIKDLIK
jgi:hypothetical protein